MNYVCVLKHVLCKQQQAFYSKSCVIISPVLVADWAQLGGPHSGSTVRVSQRLGLQSSEGFVTYTTAHGAGHTAPGLHVCTGLPCSMATRLCLSVQGKSLLWPSLSSHVAVHLLVTAHSVPREGIISSPLDNRKCYCHVVKNSVWDRKTLLGPP